MSFKSKVRDLFPHIPQVTQAHILEIFEWYPSFSELSNFERLGCETRNCFYCHEECNGEQSHRPFSEQLKAYFTNKLAPEEIIGLIDATKK